MAAKLLQSLTDENIDLQKQIGCMTGIFQMFDRQQMITGGRRIVASTPKRLPPGKSPFVNGASERDSNNEHLRSTTMHEKYSNKNPSDRQQQRVSTTESSRASFTSSSRSSSFSSLDCNRAPNSFDRITFPETPSRDPSMTHHNSSNRQQILDIRDLVKDSMYRDIHGLSVRSNEPMEFTRSKSSHHSKESSSSYKDAPRFSYDGRETKSKKDLPRLSLDSRESSMQSLKSDSKSNFSLKSTKESGEFDRKIQNLNEKPGNQLQSRPPSVVAKLMGLETLPDSVSETNIGSSRSYQDENFAHIFAKNDPIRQTQVPNSLKNSPNWRDSSIKPMARFPIEPAPWKQIDGSRISQRPISRNLSRAPNNYPTVYSEIEKRLKDLEFTQSGKDLRALKQILEAMQAKGLLDMQKEGQDSNFTTHNKDHEQKVLGSSTKRRVVPVRNYDSPIVIMKPAKLLDRSGIPSVSIIPLDGFSGLPKIRGSEFVDSRNRLASGKTVNNSSSKSSQQGNSVKSKSERALKVAKDGNSVKISGSISPRMQQKKPEQEKRSRPPTIPDSVKLRKQPNRAQGESISPGGRRRAKPSNSQQSDDQASQTSGESRTTSGHGNEGSVVSNEKKSNSTPILNEEESAESCCAPPEYSSPVSVLDNGAYKEESPSPVKKYIGKSLKVDASTDTERNSTSVQSSSPTTEINRKKLENIENLVQKLRRLNSNHDEAQTDYIASLCENSNPDHRYISEILLASGLILNLANFQFHPSGYPINPDLFLVLEQTKASTNKTTKFHRKLVFDSVNEILAGKLTQFSDPWMRPISFKKSTNAQKLLRELCCEIEQLQAKDSKNCEEEDDRWKIILSDDVQCRSESWVNFDGEISGAVLDIERLIFKDLVGEIVMGESTKKTGRCRNLFSK